MALPRHRKKRIGLIEFPPPQVCEHTKNKMVLQFPACYKNCRAPKYLRKMADPPLLCLAIRQEFKQNRRAYNKAKEVKPDKNVRYYQPAYDREVWDDKNFHDFMVYKFKKHAKQDFPTLPINTLRNGDVPHPVYMDA